MIHFTPLIHKSPLYPIDKYIIRNALCIFFIAFFFCEGHCLVLYSQYGVALENLKLAQDEEHF